MLDFGGDSDDDLPPPPAVPAPRVESPPPGTPPTPQKPKLPIDSPPALIQQPPPEPSSQPPPAPFLVSAPLPQPAQVPPSRPLSPSPEPTRCTTRISRPPGEWWKVKQTEPVIWSDDDEEDELANSASSISEPKSFAAALKTDQASQWRDAATLEFNILVGNDTWEIVKLPPGAKVIDSGWVFKVKMNLFC